MGGTGKASVDVLAVWNFATEEEKSVDVDDGDGNDGASSDEFGGTKELIK